MASRITGTWEQTPRGVVYAREHVEYQEFPEEFFSGTDCVIYFGDTYIDDITGLQFALAEKVRPIYGYASYTWDTLARGTRIISGSFKIAFRETGYLYKIMERLGEIAERTGPAIGRMLAGESIPSWHAEAIQTIEEIIGTRTYKSSAGYIRIRRSEYETPPERTAIVWSRTIGEKLRMTVDWDTSRRVVVMGGKEFKPYLMENNLSYLLLHTVCDAFGYTLNWRESDQGISIWRGNQKIADISRSEYRPIQTGSGSAVMWARDLGQRLGVSVDWNSVRRTAVIGGKEFKPQRVDGDRAYVRIREVAEGLGYFVHWDNQSGDILIFPGGGGVISPDRYKTIPGQDRAVMLAENMASLLNATDHNFKVESDSIYYFGRRFERVDGVYSGPGVYVREVLENLGYTVEWVPGSRMILYGRTTGTLDISGSDVFNKSMNDYESEIWADPIIPGRGDSRQFRPYFYGSEKEAPLLEQGFDLYIVYGPLPHHVKERLNVLPDYISYDTTVKAIRNVQLQSCAQILDPTGKPIEEEYTFIARDID